MKAFNFLKNNFFSFYFPQPLSLACSTVFSRCPTFPSLARTGCREVTTPTLQMALVVRYLWPIYIYFYPILNWHLVDQQIILDHRVLLSSFLLSWFRLICLNVSIFSFKVPFSNCMYLYSFSVFSLEHNVKCLLSNSFPQFCIQHSFFNLLFLEKLVFVSFILLMKLNMALWSSSFKLEHGFK